MAFARPSITDLVVQSKSDLEARFPGAESGLRRAVIWVLARVFAGGLHGVYGYIAYLANQILPDKAESAFLVRHASLLDVAPKPAVAAEGPVIFTGANDSVAPIGTRLQRADGVAYLTTEEATIAAGTATVAVEAVEPGASGLASAGVQLTLVSPVAGFLATATVGEGGLSGGENAESEPYLRSRTLFRMRKTPQGGSLADYERWARECPGVTRAWVRKGWYGPGTVAVLFVYDERPDIIPTADDRELVAAYIADGRAPVTATVYAVSPVPIALDPAINLAPDTATQRTAVQAELADLLAREAEPGVTIIKSHLEEAISTAPGETDHDLVDYNDDAMAPVQIAVLGDIDWGD